jgi:cell division protein FtsL
MFKDKFKISSFFGKICLFLIVIALVFVFLSIFKEMQRKNQIQKEISALQEEAQKISRENNQIKEKIAYLESSEYQTREAKDKLGLKAPEENIIIVKPSVEKKNENDEAENEKKTDEVLKIEDQPNHIKWWNYFFKY